MTSARLSAAAVAFVTVDFLPGDSRALNKEWRMRSETREGEGESVRVFLLLLSNVNISSKLTGVIFSVKIRISTGHNARIFSSWNFHSTIGKKMFSHRHFWPQIWI